MSRKIAIDTLRGLACILLVGYHVIGSSPLHGLRLPEDHVLARINDALALLRMPLFSFLSGFVYAWRPYGGDPQKFVKGKVRRLLVPLLLVGTFFAVLQAYTPGANGAVQDWRTLHIVPVAHFWFLESLFLIFMLTLVLEHFALMATPQRFTVVWVFAALLFVANPMPIYFGLEGATFLLPFFLLGLACNRFADGLPRRPVLGFTALLLGVSCLYLLQVAPVLPDRNEFVSLVISASICVFLLQCQFQLRWLAWVGVYSFGIYLFHSMFSAASRIGLLRLGVDEVPLLVVAGLALGLAGPIAVTALLRRLPGGHLPLGESKPRAVAVPLTGAERKSLS